MSEAATIEHKLPPTERIAVKAKDAAALLQLFARQAREVGRRGHGGQAAHGHVQPLTVSAVIGRFRLVGKLHGGHGVRDLNWLRIQSTMARPAACYQHERASDQSAKGPLHG